MMNKVISHSSGKTLPRQTRNVIRGATVVTSGQALPMQDPGSAGPGHSAAAGTGFAPHRNPGDAFPGGGRKMGKIGSRLGEA